MHILQHSPLIETTLRQGTLSCMTLENKFGCCLVPETTDLQITRAKVDNIFRFSLIVYWLSYEGLPVTSRDIPNHFFFCQTRICFRKRNEDGLHFVITCTSLPQARQPYLEALFENKPLRSNSIASVSLVLSNSSYHYSCLWIAPQQRLSIYYHFLAAHLCFCSAQFRFTARSKKPKFIVQLSVTRA